MSVFTVSQRCGFKESRIQVILEVCGRLTHGKWASCSQGLSGPPPLASSPHCRDQGQLPRSPPASSPPRAGPLNGCWHSPSSSSLQRRGQTASKTTSQAAEVVRLQHSGGPVWNSGAATASHWMESAGLLGARWLGVGAG